jgi:transcriptional regulator with XRE-family HTH domain
MTRPGTVPNGARTPRTGGTDRWIGRAVAATVAGLAGIAGAISYSHMRQLAQDHGQAGWHAHAFPLSVDGIEVVASLVLLADRRTGRRSGWLPWAALLIGTAGSLAANVATAEPGMISRIQPTPLRPVDTAPVLPPICTRPSRETCGHRPGGGHVILLPKPHRRGIVKLRGKKVCPNPPQAPGRGAAMAKRDPETDPRAFLGAELQRVRLAAGFASQEALANRLGFDRSVIGKAETGERPPTAEVLSAWCTTCQADAELFARLGKLARSTDGPVPTWFEDWLRAEGEAHALRIWQPLIIPGLLQTPEYARALFVVAGSDDEKADELVAVRMERQAIFDRADPPHVVTVLDESVLHRLVGSPAIMSDQLGHVGSPTGRAHVQVQVVPSVRGETAGLSGGFALASCDGAPDVVNLNAVEDVTEERRSLVRHATLVFDLVRGDALPCEESRTLILEAAEQWKTR